MPLRYNRNSARFACFTLDIMHIVLTDRGIRGTLWIGNGRRASYSALQEPMAFNLMEWIDGDGCQRHLRFPLLRDTCVLHL